MPVPHDIAAETELWDAFAESAFKAEAEPSFCWTQYAGHGPGPELLGDPATVLELGCGTGRALAHLAARGVEATGVDLSPVMVAKATERWAHTGARFVFSQPPAIPGAYGPQGMYKGGFAGKAMYTYRYSYPPRVWERLLVRAGFRSADARVVEAPEPGHIGTLIVRARL
ncbi:class I SAM-dependent methyltransferase [Streptomyces montanisoli]|uniref:Class I SAM-dependent methyltransferase n=1 Tax=Streptomyces montanisoli TaxID=2798581 RepID=A0A940S042_9ACTN|nr:class I SAM-dependent methyltransferase [Streptomyces montanisoli]MBP0460464.1 class I SAM-dependent methyltransferase [Streptomyces montanisoli]